MDARLPHLRDPQKTAWLRENIGFLADYMYFSVAVVCYVIGFYICLVAMIGMNSAQPALIYLGFFFFFF